MTAATLTGGFICTRVTSRFSSAYRPRRRPTTRGISCRPALGVVMVMRWGWARTPLGAAVAGLARSAAAPLPTPVIPMVRARDAARAARFQCTVMESSLFGARWGEARHHPHGPGPLLEGAALGQRA